jgi:PKD repeat protein
MSEALKEELVTRAPQRYTVSLGQEIVNTVLVTEAHSLLSVGIGWPGSDMEMSLVSPGGAIIDRDHVPNGVTHELGTTYESYAVPNAETGEWSIRTKGLEVAPGGEQVTLDTTQTPTTNQPPFAVYATSVTEGAAPLTTAFNAEGSFDPSGSVPVYEWSFGDGTSSTGLTPTHIYGSAGTYHPELTVRAQDGLTSTYEGPPITVTPPAKEEVPGEGGGHGGSSHEGGGAANGGSPGPGGSGARGGVESFKAGGGIEDNMSNQITVK